MSLLGRRHVRIEKGFLKMKVSQRTGIWIPREIECLTDLSVSEKYLLSEIRSLTLAKGCFASNAYFAKLLGKKEDTISRMISKLKRLGYVVLKSFDGRRRELVFCLGFSSQVALETKQKKAIETSESALDFSDKPSVRTTKDITKSTIGIQGNVWKAFLDWAEHLAPSTQNKLRTLLGPEDLEERERRFFSQFMQRYGSSGIPMGI